MRRTTGVPFTAAAAPTLLRRWAGDGIFGQGQDDWAAGRVIETQVEAVGDGSWRAHGTVGDDDNAFRVSVSYDAARGFDSDCACPYGYRCRHAVALVLGLEADERSTAPGVRWQAVLDSLISPVSEPAPGQTALLMTVDVADSPPMPQVFPWPQCLWVSAARGRLRQDGKPGSGRPIRFASRRPTLPTTVEELVVELLTSLDKGVAARATSQGEAIPIPPAATSHLLELLAEMPHVYDPQGRPLTIAPHALHLSLVTTDAAGGGCAVHPIWLDEQEQPVPLDQISVLGEWLYCRGTLYRLAAPVPAGIQPMIQKPLIIPAADLGEFTERFMPKLVSAGKLHVGDHSPPSILTDIQPMPHLLLEERAGELVGTLHLAYGDGVATDLTDERELLPWPGGAWVRRQPEAEQAFATRLQQLPWRSIGQGVWAVSDVDALDIVCDRVPELLSEGWAVFGSQNLPSFRVTSRRPRVTGRISSGIDWFELRQDVWVGNEAVPRDALLEAIRQRRTWVRLGNGEHARLPEAWLLAQSQAQDLLESPDDTTLRIRKYQAPMLADLIETVDEAEISPDWSQFWSRLQRFEAISRQPIPASFQGVLRPYQQAGYDYLCFLRDHGLHGILADDMGLGKTIQTLVLLAAEAQRGNVGPTLLVAPTSVVQNWAAEATRFVPDLKVGIWQGKDRHQTWDNLGELDVLITSYALVWRDLSYLQEQAWHYVILDEAQMVKNPSSQTSRAVRRLQAKHRLALTGTPIENNLTELWSLFAFLLPGLLGSERAFRRNYESPISAGDQDMMAELRRRVAPFILRRLKDQVATDLPPRTDVPLLVDLLPGQRRFYESVLASCREEVMASVAAKGWQRSQMTAIEALLRLRQICCDPRLLSNPDAQRLPSAKLIAFSDLVQEVIAEGHRVLVFSQFVKMLQLLQQHLSALGIEHFYLDGKTKDRLSLVNAFNAGTAPVFLISLKAGGTGLNLTGADYVIHFDPWWNPAAEDQATDRAHRIGQDKPVFSYKLIARDTVEEKIIALQSKKRSLVDGLLHAELGRKQLTADDLAYLFAPSAALTSDDAFELD